MSTYSSFVAKIGDEDRIRVTTNTYIDRILDPQRGDYFELSYRDNVIIRAYEDETLISLCGWPTATTRRKINDHAEEFKVWRKDHVQYVAISGITDQEEMNYYDWYSSRKGRITMAELPPQGHEIVIDSIDHYGVNTHLECVGHPEDGCDAQSWFANCHISEIADIPDLNIRIPVAFHPNEDGLALTHTRAFQLSPTKDKENRMTNRSSATEPAPVMSEDADGTREWRLDGKLHRLDGPAMEFPSGSRSWWIDGKLHRLDGPATEYADGTRVWHQNGLLHRTDGPAIEGPDGTRSWWQNGKLHRDDGPAVEYPDGHREWWVNGERRLDLEA